MGVVCRVIDISGATTVAATVPVRRYVVRESLVKHDGSSSNTPVGVLYQDLTRASQPVIKRPAPSTTDQVTDFTVPPPEDASFHGPVGEIIANGPSVNVGVGVGAGASLFTATPVSSTTSLEVWEIF